MIVHFMSENNCQIYNCSGLNFIDVEEKSLISECSHLCSKDFFAKIKICMDLRHWKVSKRSIFLYKKGVVWKKRQFSLIFIFPLFLYTTKLLYYRILFETRNCFFSFLPFSLLAFRFVGILEIRKSLLHQNCALILVGITVRNRINSQKPWH